MAKGKDNHLTTAFPVKERLQDYDPITSRMAYDWNLYRAIFSPLVEYTADGNLVSAAAKKFYWHEGSLIFEFRDDFRTIDGMTITADDAAASLKRVLVRSENAHGDLKSVLGAPDVLGIDQDIPQIKVEASKLVIKPIRQTPFLVSMLSSLDFAILPRSAIDTKTFEIKDFRNTSGPYFVESFGPEVILKANPLHWHYSKIMPQVVRIVRDKYDSDGMPISLKMFRAGNIDLIPMHGFVSVSQIEELSGRPGIRMHRTVPAYMTYGVFTPKGRRRSVSQRNFIAKKFQESFKVNFKGPHRTFVEQFLPPGSHGGFDVGYLDRFAADRSKAKAEVPDEVVISVVPPGVDSCRAGLKDAPFKVQIRRWEDRDFDFDSYQGRESEADIVMKGQDISYEEDIALLGFSLEWDVFGLSKNQSKEWLTTYIYEESPENRIDMVRRLQYRALVEDPSVIPLFMTHYVAASQNGWEMNFSKTMALMSFWEMSKQN